jgi:hypothetical protein
MQVPASIYGFYPEVKRRMRRLVPQMKRGASFEEAIGSEHLIETAGHDGDILGDILLSDADNDFAGRKDFHPIYVLDHVLGGLVDGILPREMEEAVFNTCLGSAWGLLLLLPDTLSIWVKPKHRWVPFLRAAARFWPVLEAEGSRYVYITSASKPLAHTITTVDYILVNAGIFRGGPDLLRPPDWPVLVEAYAERRKYELH